MTVKTALILLLSTMVVFAAELPRTLGGVAPGENVEAYLGVLGYPSTQVNMGAEQIWSWGEGLLVVVDNNKMVTEVIITRPGRQRELGFDIGDGLAQVTEKLGKSDDSSMQSGGSRRTYRDAKSGLMLSLWLNENSNIEKISLAIENQSK
jgi:hypothetical protein